MKKVSKLIVCSFFLITAQTVSFSQGFEGNEAENYVRSNIALTNFKIVGVSTRQYARCVESVNFLERGNRLRFTVINKDDFADDGKNNDLVAGDGVMTSKALYDYVEGERKAMPREYIPAPGNLLLHDKSFAHASKINSQTTIQKFSISCDVYWKSCNKWPQELQSICRSITWPFNGHVVIENCKITYTTPD